MRYRNSRQRDGTALVAVIVLLLLLHLVIIGIVVTTARDHNLTVRRIETLQAFYGAEAGINMSVREMRYRADEDGDGTVGTISDDSDAGTDPSIGPVRWVVTSTPAGSNTMLTSEGRSGEARRTITGVMADP